MATSASSDRSCSAAEPQLSSAPLVDLPRSRSARSEPARLTGSLRLTMGLTGAVMWSLLVVAFCLRPDSRGTGTHEQLGLPPCTFAMICGFRCPSCGMTTSWAHLTHGHVAQALQNSASGSLLACLALLGGGHLLASAATGRWVTSWKNENTGAVLAAAFGALVLIEWIIRLAATK
jgi:hypothetical protein